METIFRVETTRRKFRSFSVCKYGRVLECFFLVQRILPVVIIVLTQLWSCAGPYHDSDDSIMISMGITISKYSKKLISSNHIAQLLTPSFSFVLCLKLDA